MNAQYLVRWANANANAIGESFQAKPDKTEARAGIASQIRKVWAPSMPHQLALHLAHAQGRGWRPIFRTVLEAHASILE